MAEAKQSTNTQLSDYITSAEAAKILDLTQRRIAQLCADGVLEGIKIARRWLVKREAVYSYQKNK